ncbi:hypothetical protein DV711_15060 [Motiliproteus coralliicola]|uniref:Uncharacterized protein n=1 Tax=Motiliproteus coralliicola TaxID=2283196 RepID=A0A369WA98_9GAMM|nr:hypothetical protein DV711_15060 [Motiliproteus coralliicola]
MKVIYITFKLANTSVRKRFPRKLFNARVSRMVKGVSVFRQGDFEPRIDPTTGPKEPIIFRGVAGEGAIIREPKLRLQSLYDYFWNIGICVRTGWPQGAPKNIVDICEMAWVGGQ